MTWLTVTEYLCVTNDHGYVPFVVLSLFIPCNRISTKETLHVTIMEQEQLTLQQRLSSSLFVGFALINLYLYLYFCRLFWIFLSLFVWSLDFLYVFDLHLLIQPLVFPNVLSFFLWHGEVFMCTNVADMHQFHVSNGCIFF